MALVTPAAHASATTIYIPHAIASLLAQHAIEASHLTQLLSNSHVMRALRHFDQLRRDISANPGMDMAATLQRIAMAQQMVVSWIHTAWVNTPKVQEELENAEVQIALIDALLCTQP